MKPEFGRRTVQEEEEWMVQPRCGEEQKVV